jgi:D-amino-acid oxidase
MENAFSSVTNGVPKVCVIGAGTVGLSCAYRLHEELGSTVKVTIISDKFFNETVSFVSGGLWEPYLVDEKSANIVNAWGKYAFEQFQELHHSQNAAKAGVQLIHAYHFYENDIDIPYWSSSVFNFQRLSQMEIDKMKMPGRFTSAFSFGTFVVDQKYYMQYLMAQLRRNEVEIIQKSIANLQDFINESDYDVIINCVGLASSHLAQDSKITPIRGQILRVR